MLSSEEEEYKEDRPAIEQREEQEGRRDEVLSTWRGIGNKRRIREDEELARRSQQVEGRREEQEKAAGSRDRVLSTSEGGMRKKAKTDDVGHSVIKDMGGAQEESALGAVAYEKSHQGLARRAEVRRGAPTSSMTMGSTSSITVEREPVCDHRA